MPNLNTKPLTNPDALHRIRRESLLAWLAPAADYFAERGAILPHLTPDPNDSLAPARSALGGPSPAANSFRQFPTGSSPQGGEGNAEIDYDMLAHVFVEAGEGMPEYLVDSLFIILEMADEAGMDAILDAQEEYGLVLQVGDDPDPADVAVQAWLQDKELLEQIHNQHQLTRPRSFTTFVAEVSEPPDFVPPTAEQIAALEARLAAWFGKRKRGHDCRILVFPREKQCLFLVRHGLPCKREGTFNDGKSDSVFYRPRKHDVVVYDIENAELQMNCCGVREMKEFQLAFGAHLFANENFFPGDAKYTFAPLVEKGRNCLACGEVAGIESVTLREVDLFYAGKPWQRITRRSDDVFLLVEKELFKWPSVDRITRATFEVRFKDSKKVRRVTIIGSNKAQYGRDGDMGMIEQWLKLAGFILTKTETEDEE